jgi:hypothetical protein
MERFLGKPKTQKTAATEDVNVSDLDLLEWLEGSPEGSVIAEIASTLSMTHITSQAILTQLLDQQKVMAEQ